MVRKFGVHPVDLDSKESGFEMESGGFDVFYTGWCSEDAFSSYVETFRPCVFRNVPHNRFNSLNPFHSSNIRASISHKLVEVSCSSSQEFRGHPLSRVKTDVSFSDFMNAFFSSDAEDITSRTTCGTNVFLSQCCLHSRDRNEIEVSELENFALSTVPPSVNHSALQSINLWANIQPSTSSLHYDANHNILFVLQGQKRIHLFPPSATSALQPYGAHLESPNHSHLTATELMQAVASGEIAASKVELGSGDALFIPEGWWHFVESVERTVALNYWFESPLQQLLARLPHMAPYILRTCVHNITSMACAKQLTVSAQAVAGSTASATTTAAAVDEEATTGHGKRLARDAAPSSSDIHHHHGVEKRPRRSVTLDVLVASAGTVEAFTKTWVSSAEQHPDELLHALALCSDEEAARILSAWDHLSTAAADDAGAAFAAFFAQLGDERAQHVHQTLLSKQTRWRNRVGVTELDRLLGT